MTYKICTKCKKEKSVSEFQKRGTGYQPHCKLCHRVNCANHYRQNKQAYKDRSYNYKQELVSWYNELKLTLKCSQCEENHPATLEFHHLDPTSKLDTVSDLVAQYKSKQIILDEISKCIVLCSNCHRKLHYSENRFIHQSSNRQDPSL